MIPTLALAATLLADPLDRVCQQPIYRDGGVVGMRVVDCDEPPSCDLGEVLAAARAVEPWLVNFSEQYYSEYDAGPERDALRPKLVAARDAAIARLRSALARCPAAQDDGDQVNPPQVGPVRP